MEPSQGNMVSVSTFQIYQTDNAIGLLAGDNEVGDKKMVNFPWFKLYIKH